MFFNINKHEIEQNIVHKTRVINENNLINFVNLIGEVEWVDSDNMNSNKYANLVIKTLSTSAAACFSLKSVSNKKLEVKWFKNELRAKRREVYATRAKLLSTNSPIDWDQFCQLRKDYRKSLKKAKRDVCEQKITEAENKSRAIWMIANHERKTKHHPC